MVRYTLTKRVYLNLQRRGYKLICKICEKPLGQDENGNFKEGTCIESKPSKYKRRKFYHCECYDGSFIDLGDDDGDSEDD